MLLCGTKYEWNFALSDSKKCLQYTYFFSSVIDKNCLYVNLQPTKLMMVLHLKKTNKNAPLWITAYLFAVIPVLNTYHHLCFRFKPKYVNIFFLMIAIGLLFCNIFYLVLKVVRSNEVFTDVYGDNQVTRMEEDKPYSVVPGSLQCIRT